MVSQGTCRGVTALRPVALLPIALALTIGRASAPPVDRDRGASPETGDVIRGVSSWYGPDFDGRPTASGETYDMDGRTPPENVDKQAKILSIRVAKWEDIEPLLEDAQAEFDAEPQEDVFGDPTYGKIPYWTPDQDAEGDHGEEDTDVEGEHAAEDADADAAHEGDVDADARGDEAAETPAGDTTADANTHVAGADRLAAVRPVEHRSDGTVAIRRSGSARRRARG